MIDLQQQIKGVIGRELNEPGTVVHKTEEEGVEERSGSMARRESEESEGLRTVVGSYEGDKGSAVFELIKKFGLTGVRNSEEAIST